MKKITLMACAAMVLAGCNQAQESEIDDAPLAEAAMESGSALLTMGDGVQVLAHVAADGTAYTGDLLGLSTPFTVEDGKGCVESPDGKLCIAFGAVGEDGYFAANSEMAPPSTVKWLSKDYSTGDVPVVEPGAMLLKNEGGGHGMVVWSADGKSYFTPETSTLSWRDVDGKRCFTAEGDDVESCITRGETAEDGSFTVTPDEGEPYTVMQLG